MPRWREIASAWYLVFSFANLLYETQKIEFQTFRGNSSNSTPYFVPIFEHGGVIAVHDAGNSGGNFNEKTVIKISDFRGNFSNDNIITVVIIKIIAETPFIGNDNVGRGIRFLNYLNENFMIQFKIFVCIVKPRIRNLLKGNKQRKTFIFKQYGNTCYPNNSCFNHITYIQSIEFI